MTVVASISEWCFVRRPSHVVLPKFVLIPVRSIGDTFGPSPSVHLVKGKYSILGEETFEVLILLRYVVKIR